MGRRAVKLGWVGSVYLVASCLGACAGKTDSGGPTYSPDGSGMCPPSAEEGLDKIHHLAYLQAHPDKAHSVMVSLGRWLGDLCLPGESGCETHDEALSTLGRENASDVDCVVAGLARDSKRPVLGAAWYRRVSPISSGQIIPLGVSFTITASLDEVMVLARDQHVAAIDPAPGHGAGVPVTAQTRFEDCPQAPEPVDGKAADAASILGMGRQPVVIEVSEKILPGVLDCNGGANSCAAAENREWERTILSVRALTCIRQWIDAHVDSIPEPIQYGAGSGSATSSLLAPFAQSPGVTSALAMTLDWDEVQRVAQHPWVQRIWTSSGLMQPEPADPQCPPDLGSPIPPKTCSDEVEPIDGKFDKHNREILKSAQGEIEVAIQVTGGAKVCSLDTCAVKPCDSSAAIEDRWRQENLESQKCVRAKITELHGVSSPDTTWLVNSFIAKLTWEQIKSVASCPDVLKIESNLQ